MNKESLYPVFNAAFAAIRELQKIVEAFDQSGLIYRQMSKNFETLATADQSLGSPLSERVESNVLEILEALEKWMLHNRKEQGALDIFFQLRILNTHLLMQYYDRYR